MTRQWLQKNRNPSVLWWGNERKRFITDRYKASTLETRLEILSPKASVHRQVHIFTLMNYPLCKSPGYLLLWRQ